MGFYKFPLILFLLVQSFPPLSIMTKYGRLVENKEGRIDLVHPTTKWNCWGHRYKTGEVILFWSYDQDWTVGRPGKMGTGIYEYKNENLYGYFGWYGELYFNNLKPQGKFYKDDMKGILPFGTP